jgi:hypothetical protein
MSENMLTKSIQKVLSIFDPNNRCNWPMIIAVDFDGTVVKHEYPEIGEDVPGAVNALQALNKAGYKIILWTMRSGEYLDDAVRWFEDRGIELYAVQENPEQKEWTESPKAFANLYIDDAAFGCPLIRPFGERPYVDWKPIVKALIQK